MLLIDRNQTRNRRYETSQATPCHGGPIVHRRCQPTLLAFGCGKRFTEGAWAIRTYLMGLPGEAGGDLKSVVEFFHSDTISHRSTRTGTSCRGSVLAPWMWQNCNLVVD